MECDSVEKQSHAKLCKAEVKCLGNETRLDQCSFLNWGEHAACRISATGCH